MDQGKVRARDLRRTWLDKRGRITEPGVIPSTHSRHLSSLGGAPFARREAGERAWTYEEHSNKRRRGEIRELASFHLVTRLRSLQLRSCGVAWRNGE